MHDQDNRNKIASYYNLCHVLPRTRPIPVIPGDTILSFCTKYILLSISDVSLLAYVLNVIIVINVNMTAMQSLIYHLFAGVANNEEHNRSI